MPEDLIPKIIWQKLGDGTTRYAVLLPNTRERWRRWLWQARLDRRRHMRTLLSLTVVSHGVADPEPYHGGFI